MSVDSVFVDLEGICLHAAIAGPKDGEVVILLHGFPEFWMSWRYQIVSLVKHGFRVIALDQRGYNLSDKPDKIADLNRPGFTRHFRAVGIDVFRTLPEKRRQTCCDGVLGCRTSRCNERHRHGHLGGLGRSGDESAHA